MSRRIIGIILLLLSLAPALWSQMDTIPLSNPSLEGVPHQGGEREIQILNGMPAMAAKGVRFWQDCGVINFPSETPPDLHGINTGFFDHKGGPSHGSSFLGMVSRSNDTYESISQKLTAPLEGGKCYELNIDLMRSDNYLSATKEDENKLYNYSKPIILYLYGGTGLCGDQELLAQSPYVKNTDWKTYTLSFKPSRRLKFITIEVSYKRPTLSPYNGNILVDNLQPIVQVTCPGEEPTLAAVTEETNVPPPHKRRKKKVEPKKEIVDIPPTPTEVAVVPAAKKKVLELDRENIQTNQRIEIKNLYFEADTSTITEGSEEVLLEVFDFLKDNDDITIEVGGHTNGVPKHAYCDKLSRERAKEVASYLVRKGIQPIRITYKGYGKRRPVASNQTPMGRKKNQRVEITITAMDS